MTSATSGSSSTISIAGRRSPPDIGHHCRWVMRRFASLYEQLDRTTSTNAKVAALAAYFREAPSADAAWALYFLTGQRLKRLLPGRSLGTWGAEAAGVPDWLLAESYESVGDAAETIALLLDEIAQPSDMSDAL